MSKKEFILPDLGDFSDTEVVEIYVEVGAAVNENDPVLGLETDKAVMDIPAPFSGKLLELEVSMGDKVNSGDLVAIFETAEAANETTEKEAEKAPNEEAASVESAKEIIDPKTEDSPAVVKAETAPVLEAKQVNSQRPGGKFHASPSVRQFSRELGVDLDHVSGTGPNGRITQDDVHEYIKSTLKKFQSAMESAPAAQPMTGGSGIPPIPKVDFSKFGEIEVTPLKRIKKLSGAHLLRCWLNVPHVTHFDEADITELDSFRKSLKAQMEKEGLKLSPLLFILKATAAALKQFPSFNASLDGDNLVLKKYCHIGVAVDTPNGLVVPVIRDVDTKSIKDLAAELMAISGRAREGKIGPEEMQGGCFTISSLGGIGGTNFTPIVNAPEVAIMGVSKSKMQPQWNGSEFVPRLMLPFSLSYDHRVVDGAEAARFSKYVSQMLTDIRQMIL